MSRKKKLAMNMISALLLQVVSLVCGFILPRQMLSYFGSDVNGLVASIAKFLGVITFLELGIGSVIQSNLYKPLAEKDEATISKIFVSAERFYRRIAYVFLVYIAILFVAFPLVNREFDFWFTASLLVIIAISTFAQYFFGISYQVFLTADQKSYIHATLRILTTILNLVVAIILIKVGCTIHVVKLVSASIFLLQPIALNLYVRKRYNIDRKIQYTGEPIKQKWNGFAQHLAGQVCSDLDVILLTVFHTYQSVSIYSVYILVIHGILNLVMTSASGLESLMGNMLAKKEKTLLQKLFEAVESVTHVGVTFLFLTTAILIAPFVSVYVRGIEDASAYNLPLLGALLTIAFGIQCLRIPYARIIKAAGHYKQTQNGAIISLVLNIVVSLLLVIPLGLIGVALGTLVAMLYHTVYFAWYLRKNILDRPIKHFAIHFAVDILCGVAAFTATGWLCHPVETYLQWVIMAIPVALMVLAICLVLNAPLYGRELLAFAKTYLKKHK